MPSPAAHALRSRHSAFWLLALVALCFSLVGEPAHAGAPAKAQPSRTKRVMATAVRAARATGKSVRRTKAVIGDKLRKATQYAKGSVGSISPLVMAAPAWLQAKPLAFPKRVRLDYRARPTRTLSRLSRNPIKLDKSLVQAGKTKQSSAYTRLLIDRALTLKNLYRDKEMYAKHRWNKRVKGGGKSLNAMLEREIARTPVFATDRRGKLRDRRVLRKATDIRKDADLMMAAMKAMPELRPRNLSLRQMNKAVGKALKLLDGKAIYTREGQMGVFDVLNDAFVGTKIGLSDQHMLRVVAATASTLQTFEYQKLPSRRAKNGNLPLELRVLLSQRPELGATLRAVQASGVDLQLQKVRRTPNHVLEAIARIAVLSQENFLRNWLQPMILDGASPVLRPTKMGVVRAKEMGLIGKRANRAEQIKTLEADVRTIRASTKHYLKIVPSGKLNKSQAAKVSKLNRALAGLRRKHTARRMVFDNADSRTHEAQEVIKKMPAIAAAAHTLEHVGLGPIAKLVAASADDLVGEYAEIKALLGSGFSKGELYKRLRIAVPVFGVATVGALSVDPLLHAGHEVTAGALFGFSAVALSLATSLQSVGMYKQAYSQLVKDGKIPGKIGALVGNKQFQKRLNRFDRDARALTEAHARPKLLKMVRSNLERLRKQNPKLLSAAEITMIVKDLAKLDLSGVMQQVKQPSKLQAWKEAIKQDFSNPARLGLLLGAISAPGAGIAVASAGLLDNGLIMAAVGSAETVVAASTVKAARLIDDWRYQRGLRRELKKASR